MTLYQKNVITNCGECPGSKKGRCEFADRPLDRSFLNNLFPPVWCPLRKDSFVVETVLSQEEE